jgi:hypothetical protein
MRPIARYAVVFSFQFKQFFSKADTKDMAGYVSSKAYMSWLCLVFPGYPYRLYPSQLKA